jgi:hypothetical protein
MKKSDAIELFGGAVNMGKQIGVTHQAVYKLPEELPRSTERKVRKALADFLSRSGAARVAVAAFLIGVLLQACPVHAQVPPTCDQRQSGPWSDIRVTWAPPTQYTNNTAIPAGTALMYRVSRQQGTGAWAVQCQTTEPRATIWNTAAGSYSIRVTAVLNGQESAPSATAAIVLAVPLPVPKAPGSLVIVVPLEP